MTAGFDHYFERGERYAVLFIPARGARVPGPRERELIAAWANHPRVLDFAKRLCVGTAVVIENLLLRAALSAIIAVRKSTSNVEPVPTPAKGLDYCLRCIKAEGLPLSKPPDLLRYELLQQVEAAL